MIQIIFVVLLFSFVSSDTPPIRKCESPGGHVLTTNITNTKTIGGRYILKRGTKAGIVIELELLKDVQRVTAAARGIINGVPIPYPLPNPNGCTSLQCPLKKGGPYTYSAFLDILFIYPPIVVDVEWKLRDEDDIILACIIIPARID